MTKKARFKLKTVVGDAAYCSREIYSAAEDHRTPVVVPRVKNARVSRRTQWVRNRSVERIETFGRQR
jgi:hypothetical protein